MLLPVHVIPTVCVQCLASVFSRSSTRVVHCSVDTAGVPPELSTAVWTRQEFHPSCPLQCGHVTCLVRCLVRCALLCGTQDSPIDCSVRACNGCPRPRHSVRIGSACSFQSIAAIQLSSSCSIVATPRRAIPYLYTHDATHTHIYIHREGQGRGERIVGITTQSSVIHSTSMPNIVVGIRPQSRARAS